MKGVFVMNTSLHDILFMILDNELRRHYQEIAVKQGLCQVTNSDSSSTQLNRELRTQVSDTSKSAS